MSGAQHSHETAEHYTPKPIVDAAREALGGVIDLDPASCAFANEVVRAEVIFQPPSDGLAFDWHGRVFCNPPGKVKGARGGQALWWAKAWREVASGNALAVIFVSFSVELLQTAQNLNAPHPLLFPCCFPRKRIAFDQHIDDKIASVWTQWEKAADKGRIDKTDKLYALGKELEHQKEAGITRVAGNSPPHSSMIVCVTTDSATRERFCTAFAPFGFIL